MKHMTCVDALPKTVVADWWDGAFDAEESQVNMHGILRHFIIARNPS